MIAAMPTNGQVSPGDRVSVVIPAYNGSAFIGEALETLFAQTLPPREIIVVDDASTDDTVAVVEAIARDAAVPVRLLRLRQNSGGPTHPMNVGVAAARSPLVALLDQDDLLPNDRLERQVRALARHPEAGLSCGRYVSVDRQGVPREEAVEVEKCWEQIEKEHRGGSLWWVPARTAFAALVRFGNVAGGASSLCFPRPVWQQVKGFDTSLRVAWDFDFVFKVATRWGLLYDAEPLSFLRYHGGNLSRAHGLGNLELSRIRWKQFRSPAARRSGVDCRGRLSETSLHLAYCYREHGQYAASAAAYLAHFFYGNKLHALGALARLPLHALRARQEARRNGRIEC